MAVTYDAISSNRRWDTTASTLSYSHTCSGGNRLLVVAVGINDTGDGGATVTSVTYNSVSMTQVQTKQASGLTPRVYVFRLIAPTTGSNTIAITASENVQIASNSISFKGVHQTSPVDASSTTELAGGATSNTSITTTVANTYGLSFAYSADGQAINQSGWAALTTNYYNDGGTFAHCNGSIWTSIGTQTTSWTVNSSRAAAAITLAVRQVIIPAQSLIL